MEPFADQSELIEFLSRPETFALAGETVERHTTHGSFVFLAGARAYKLKRAVRFAYMDYSTLEKRRAMCEAELIVNRRLAPEIYVGVEPVVRKANGSLHIGRCDARDEVLDWLVVMRRFRQDDLFDSLCKHHRLDIGLARKLGERIARFHLGAERHPNFGGARAIAEVLDENRQFLGEAAGMPFAKAKIEALDRAAREVLGNLADQLDARRVAGFVRRCHGDLHLNNICLFEGNPVPFDAIEFRDDFACIDVLYDLALLLTDLDRRGERGLANAVLNAYLEATHDYSGLAALPLFLSCRAAMRAHVAVAMAIRRDGQLSAETASEANHLLDCALSYLERADAVLVSVGGVSGTGKSTLAAALAPEFGLVPGAIVLRSDVIRKELWGADRMARLPAAAYAEQTTEKVYATINARAGMILKAGYCVIADAVFGEETQRRAIADATGGSRFVGFWLTAPIDLLERRVAIRSHDPSDATIEVLRRQLAHVVPPPDWIIVDAALPTTELVAHVRERATRGARPDAAEARASKRPP